MIKAYLWVGLKSVSNSYHEWGSVLIQAETVERARELAVITSHGDQRPMQDVSVEPDAVFICEPDNQVEKVWVFPDSGCC